MSAPRALPARPSVDSLRKQAKALAREVAAGDATANSRARAQLPRAELPLSLRDAQLVVAREYGFAGWQDLVSEAEKRSGHGLAWAASAAERIIHDNNIEGLKRLLAEYPALLTWGRERGGILSMATGSYGDSSEAWREERFTRRACAELLLDAGAIVAPSVADAILQARAHALLDLFRRRGLLPRMLKFLAALGDVDGVRAQLATASSQSVFEALGFACSYRQTAVGALLLDRGIAFEPELGHRIDAWGSRAAFLEQLIAHGVSVDAADARPLALWRAFMMQNATRAFMQRDWAGFVRALDENPWLLDESNIAFQSRLFEIAIMNDLLDQIPRLFELDMALLHRTPAPPARAIEFALTYAKARAIPDLLRIWPAEDTLPFAAGTGDLAAVKRWFSDSGAPELGNPAHHLPPNQPDATLEHETRPPTVQGVLDTALAYACLNNQFEIADFLLARGADINTRWCSHEPASILHELVWYKNYEAMQFLIDRGIDMTIRDFRWDSTAEGWARYAAGDETLANWLAEHAKARS